MAASSAGRGRLRSESSTSSQSTVRAYLTSKANTAVKNSTVSNRRNHGHQGRGLGATIALWGKVREDMRHSLAWWEKTGRKRSVRAGSRRGTCRGNHDTHDG